MRELKELKGQRARRLAACIIGLLLVILIAVASLRLLAGPRGQDETWARIQREGVMRVGMDASWPPFEYVDEDGQIVGFDVDLARELGRRLGVEVEFVNLGFDGLYDALKSGKCDAIISALPYDPMMTKDVAYSHSYFNAGEVLVVRDDEREIDDESDLKGKRVGVEWGSTADMEARRLAERIEGMELALYGTSEEALWALKDGEVEAAIADAVSAYGFIKAEGGVKIVGEPLTDEPYVIAVRLESRILLERINEALGIMKEDGNLDSLVRKWF